MSSVFCPILMCHWDSWRVISPRILRLDCPALNFCDMAGAIQVAQSLVPDVLHIDVYVDSKLDITYQVDPYGFAWEAVKP